MKKIYVSIVGATDSNLSYYSWIIEKRQSYTAASIIISGVLQKILVPGIQRKQKTKRIKEQYNLIDEYFLVQAYYNFLLFSHV